MFDVPKSVLDRVSVPTLILDEERCKANIRHMAERARSHGLAFRPHFKTHQSKEIGEWFKSEGVSSITVSSLRMAKYFSDGWNDITIAFPLNLRELEELHSIPTRVELNVILEHPEVIRLAGTLLKREIGVFLTIDSGAGRTGIDPSNLQLLDECINAVDSIAQMKLKGFLTHAGHTYGARSSESISMTHHFAIEKLSHLHANYCLDFDLIISYGDTPSSSIADMWDNVHEIRPGNFVFYDLMQEQIGSCALENIAVAVACPIVSVHTGRQEAVLYGGAIHFGKDRIEEKGSIHYGRVYTTGQNSLDIGRLVRLSQEHGVVHVEEPGKLKVGDLLLVYPVHSCMTAQYIGGYLTTTGRFVDHLATSALTPGDKHSRIK